MTTQLRLAFMGSADFSVPTLRTLVSAGHDVAAVYSQPPRPAGRGHKVVKSPVHIEAETQGLAVRTPISLKDPEAQSAFADLAFDAAVVAAYGVILPKPILEAPRLGCLNVHGSLLPRWRGAAPIQRAIQAGDEESGVTIMQMDEGLDTGDMLLIGRVPITAETTATTLHDILAEMGARLMIDALAGLTTGTLEATAQPDTDATYAHKLKRDEGRIDWTSTAKSLDCFVRALNPWPGVWFEHEGERIRLLEAKPSTAQGEPGTILRDGVTVACGEGSLELKVVQRPGRRSMSADEFRRGFPFSPGIRLP